MNKERRVREFVLEREQVVRAPMGRVFAFFSDAGNLEAITPGFLHFRIVTPRPIDMRPGTMIDYRLKLHGVPVRWRSEITAWEPPDGARGVGRFVDEQRKGPYRYWIHEHRFEPAPGDAGATLVRDRVRYAVPGGALAGLVERWLVRPRLEVIFDHRRGAVERLLRGG